MKPVVSVLKAAILLLAVALVAADSGWAQSEQQQSLGDVARKQKEKKGQEEPKGKKVLTNEDLPQGTAASGSQPASSSSSAPDTASAKEESVEKAGAEAKQGEGTTAPEGDEAAMTKEQQADEARKKLEALKHDEAATEKGITHLEELMANETSESRRELYSNAINQAQQKLPEIQKKRAEAEKELADKEAAAKKAQQNPPQGQPPPQ